MLRKGLHIRKNDLVEIISGQEKRKTGKVIRVLINQRKVIIEKMNRAKKHTRPTQKNPKGGIIEIERPISSSNVLLVCLKCNKGVRTYWDEVKDKKVRVCVKCEQVLDK